jgi:hypothetical protein
MTAIIVAIMRTTVIVRVVVGNSNPGENVSDLTVGKSEELKFNPKGASVVVRGDDGCSGGCHLFSWLPVKLNLPDLRFISRKKLD